MAYGVTAASRLVLGSAQWGSRYGIANRVGPPSLVELERLVATAAAAGVGTIDTARAYGSSEELVGLLTATHARWQVVTKLADDVAPPGRSSADALDAARQSLEASRRALRRDRLDVVLLHRAADRVAYDGAIWRLLIEQRQLGSIGAIGVSADSPDEAFDVLRVPDADAVQVATSLLDQRLVRAGFFTRALERPIRVFVRSVFLQGVAHLAGEELPAHLSDFAPVLSRISDWASEHHHTPAAPYLHFARLLPASLVIGVERNQQLVDDLRTWREPADTGELEALARAIPDLRPELLTPSQWPRLARPA